MAPEWKHVAIVLGQAMREAVGVRLVMEIKRKLAMFVGGLEMKKLITTMSMKSCVPMRMRTHTGLKKRNTVIDAFLYQHVIQST